MIPHKILWLFLLAVLILAASCGSGSSKNSGTPVFFDLDTFFQGEVGRMASVRTVEKKITFNGETQERQVDDWNAEEELGGFRELHINRPAWRDQYQADSLQGPSGELTGLRYAAMDSTLRIRRVEIDWSGGAVSEVRVEKYMKNLIVFFHQTLRYRPGEGYQLWRAQKVPLRKKSEIMVEVRY